MEHWEWWIASVASLSAILVATGLMDRRRRRRAAQHRPPPGISYDCQAKEVGRTRDGFPIFGSILSDGALLTAPADANVGTIYDNFCQGLKKSCNGDCLGFRKAESETFQWFSYQDVLDRAHAFGSALLNLGLKPGNDTCIGIYAKNCPDWVVCALGCASQGVVIVPLYDTLGPEAVSFIVNQAELELIVCDTKEKAKRILEKSEEIPNLRHVVVMEAEGEGDSLGESWMRIHFLDEFLQEAPAAELHPAQPEDLYIVCYTSGTTGLPKGVMLQHQSLLINAAAGIRMFEAFEMELLPGETVISYLPLAHIFEQMVHVMTFSAGGRIGFFRGHVTQLLDDMKALRPNFFPVVPRLLNRLYDKIQIGLGKASPFSRWLFQFAYKAKLEELKRGIIRKDSIWDYLIFRKLQNELGGNVRLMVTGSAPVAPEVLEMVRVTLGAVVMEGYGQTECTAVATLTLPSDRVGGHVGGPAICSHATLMDVPELEYRSSDDRGEICLKGPCMTRGYFKNPELTAELYDEEGWLHTGDIGEWLPNGTLRIIDRKKDIFKLAQGEYVAPEKIESVYMRAPSVAQVFVDGNSLERYLVAVVVPDESELRVLWKEASRPSDSRPSLAQMCKDPKIRQAVFAQIQRVGKENGLSSLELVKAIHLCPEPFTIENNLLTPTFKAKRPQLRKAFSSVIETLYREATGPV